MAVTVSCSCAFHSHKLLLSKPNLLRVLHFHSEFLSVVSLFFLLVAFDLQLGISLSAVVVAASAAAAVFGLCVLAFHFERRAVWLCENISVNEDNMTVSQERVSTKCYCMGLCWLLAAANAVAAVYLTTNAILYGFAARQKCLKHIGREKSHGPKIYFGLFESFFYVADSFNFFYISSITSLSKQKKG